MSKIRPNWDDYFMAIAHLVSTRYTCDRLRAGAVLVKENRILASGYNGAPPRMDHCDEVGHLMEEGHCVRTIHAEHNAILQAAAIGGQSTKGSTLYTLASPCIHCAKYIVAAGIKRVVTEVVYRNEAVEKYFQDAGISYEVYEHNPEWDKHLTDLFDGKVPIKPERKDAPDINLNI